MELRTQTLLVRDYEDTTLKIMRKHDNSISEKEKWTYGSVLRVRLEILSGLKFTYTENDWKEIYEVFLRYWGG